MFRPNSILSELDAEFLSLGTRAYIGQRAKNAFYDYVIDKFRDSGMSQAALARKLEKNAGQMNRTLSGPGNWTIETIAELLAAMSGDELIPASKPFKGRARSNHRQRDMIDKPVDDGLDLSRLSRQSTDSSATPSKVRLEVHAS